MDDAGKKKGWTFARVRMIVWLLLLGGVSWWCIAIYWEGPPPPMKRIEARELADVSDDAFPDAERKTYTYGPEGKTYTYMVQLPVERPPKNADAYVIYMHGAGSSESQGLGMEHSKASFRRLRAAVAKQRWIYIVPRDYEFEGLLETLERDYGEKKVYVIGQSAGGAAVLNEVHAHPERYHGVIALCPARPRPLSWHFYVRPFDMPLYLVNGENDGLIAVFTRDFARELSKQRKYYALIEIIDGDHPSPVRNIDWPDALGFISIR